MPIKNTAHTYGSLAKFFHWMIFIFIAGLLLVGFLMTGMASGPDKFKIYGIHKATGIIVLILVLIRLGWKCTNVSPLLPDSLNVWEKWLAHAGHAALYVLIIAMPLSGWLMSSASGFSVSVFGWFTMPDLVAPDKELAKTLRMAHEWLGYAIMMMVSLHVIAALLHHFYYKNNVLLRMLPFVRGRDA